MVAKTFVMTQVVSKEEYANSCERKLEQKDPLSYLKMEQSKCLLYAELGYDKLLT